MTRLSFCPSFFDAHAHARETRTRARASLYLHKWQQCHLLVKYILRNATLIINLRTQAAHAAGNQGKGRRVILNI